MPTAWEETLGAGQSTGVRLALGSGASQNVMYTTPTLLGTTIALTWAPAYGVSDQNDKVTGDTGTSYGSSYDASININPSLGTEILAGLNVFAAGSSIQTYPTGTQPQDAYEVVGGVTYDLGPVSLGAQWSGDYTGYDSTHSSGSTGKYNLYKNFAFGVAFNVSDDLAVSYGEWKATKAGYTDASVNQIPIGDRTIDISSLQASYTMGGASFRIADTKVTNAAWDTSRDESTQTISLGLAF